MTSPKDDAVSEFEEWVKENARLHLDPISQMMTLRECWEAAYAAGRASIKLPSEEEIDKKTQSYLEAQEKLNEYSEEQQAELECYCAFDFKQGIKWAIEQIKSLNEVGE